MPSYRGTGSEKSVRSRGWGSKNANGNKIAIGSAKGSANVTMSLDRGLMEDGRVVSWNFGPWDILMDGFCTPTTLSLKLSYTTFPTDFNDIVPKIGFSYNSVTFTIELLPSCVSGFVSMDCTSNHRCCGIGRNRWVGRLTQRDFGESETQATTAMSDRYLKAQDYLKIRIESASSTAPPPSPQRITPGANSFHSNRLAPRTFSNGHTSHF